VATKKAKSRSSSGSSKKSKSVEEVDFTGTESRKGGRIPPGDYPVKVTKAISDKSPEKKSPRIHFELEITEGKHQGKTLYHDCYLGADSLWKLRNTLEAMGEEVPKKKAKLNLKKYKAKELAVTVDLEEYNGKVRSRVVDTFPLDDLLNGDEDDEELEDDDDEEDEDDDEDDEDEDDEDEDDDDEDDDEDDDDDDLEDVDLDEDDDEDD
jgi:hypothetical protein